jgi:hypothetical protein
MAEMCLYNGIKLPKMPKSPSYFEAAKYAKYNSYILFRTENGNYEFCGSQRTGHSYWETEGGIRISSHADRWKLYNGRWIWYRYASSEPPADFFLPLSQFVWSNRNIYGSGYDNVLIAGTDPVPVEQSIGMVVDHSVYVRGWFVGKRLAAMRGKAQQVTDTARLGMATLGRMILGKE